LGKEKHQHQNRVPSAEKVPSANGEKFSGERESNLNGTLEKGRGPLGAKRGMPVPKSFPGFSNRKRRSLGEWRGKKFLSITGDRSRVSMRMPNLRKWPTGEKMKFKWEVWNY